MHIVLLVIGVVLGLFGLYRFMLHANLRQAISLLLAIICLAVSAAVFLLAVTGRLPSALGIIAALYPVALGLGKRWARLKSQEQSAQAPASSGAMSRDEALEILGLTDSATRAEIIAAHKKLIKKIHPDQDGSDWLAAKINQARDLLV